MSNFYEQLKQYFENTPQNQVLEDWAKSKEFDNIGPSVEEFITYSQQYNTYTNNSNNWCKQNINEQLSPNFTSGFFINTNLSVNAKSRFFYHLV